VMATRCGEQAASIRAACADALGHAFTTLLAPRPVRYEAEPPHVPGQSAGQRRIDICSLLPWGLQGSARCPAADCPGPAWKNFRNSVVPSEPTHVQSGD
jgi:hypothetical protein